MSNGRFTISFHYCPTCHNRYQKALNNAKSLEQRPDSNIIIFDSNICKAIHLDSETKCTKIGWGVIQFSNSMCERDLGI